MLGFQFWREVSLLGRIAALCVSLLGLSAQAQVPTYSKFELQARSNFCVNPSGSFNVPCSHFFANATPTLNDNGQWAVKLDVIPPASQGILAGEAGAAGILYSTTGSISDPSINSIGHIVWPQTFSPPNGIYRYDGISSAWHTGLPFGTQTWEAVRINDAGHVGYRAKFPAGQAFYSYDGKQLAQHAIEAGLMTSPYSFLFTPAFNNQRQIAAKVRLGTAGQVGNERPDQIRIFNADGSSILIAEDRDSNAASPYTAFDNSVALNDSGWVAFVANLVAGGRGVYLSNGIETKTLASTALAEINTIEFFAPALNSHGLVAFRARDGQNRYAIFVGDGKDLRRLIGQLDELETDAGLGMIAQNDSSPTFGGSIAINNHGDIAFHCTLTPAGNNQVEWGSGIVIAYADRTKPTLGDLNGDGLVNVDDLVILLGAWGDCQKGRSCVADIAPPDGDGQVNVDDLVALLGNWG